MLNHFTWEIGTEDGGGNENDLLCNRRNENILLGSNWS